MKKIKRFGKIDLLLDLKQQGVSDINVLNVIEDVDRSLFIDTNLKEKSNLNVALPIECGQTISQPLIVAHMTQILDIDKRMRVLEIGTGSGYQSCGNGIFFTAVFCNFGGIIICLFLLERCNEGDFNSSSFD